MERFVADGDCFLLVSRLLPYKHVSQVVEAFRGASGRRLVVVGDGPLRTSLEHELPSNVRLVSGTSDAQLRWLYSRAAALIAPSYEDLGLTVLEAAALGKPTLALRAGGYLETVIDGVTGCFFATPTAKSIRTAVDRFSANEWDAEVIRAHASTFSQEQFAAMLATQVDAVLEAAIAATAGSNRGAELSSSGRNPGAESGKGALRTRPV
jgi:glycosyltransferase involved in cell wall biosynthesis